MSEPDPPKLSEPAEQMIRKVGSAQERLVRARQRKGSDWESIAIMGVIGWSVALPTLIGVGLGMWIDHRWPGRFSWTLMLLIGGLLAGCANAWMHVKGDPS